MVNRCKQEGRRVEHSLQRAVDQLREASSNANAALRAENVRLAALAAELQEEVHAHLTQSVVLRKTIPTRIRQIILYITNGKG